jgi:hypothetical protein
MCINFLSLIILQLQGLQHHLDIINSQENLSKHKWKGIDVNKWKITEKLQKPIQKDGYREHKSYKNIVIHL